MKYFADNTDAQTQAWAKALLLYGIITQWVIMCFLFFASYKVAQTATPKQMGALISADMLLRANKFIMDAKPRSYRPTP